MNENNEVNLFEKENYTVLNSDNIEEILNNVNINDINLRDYDILNKYKFLYTDYKNPFVIKKDSMTLFINPIYWLDNTYECEKLIIHIINNFKGEKFNLAKKGLLTDFVINALCNNEHIKEVTIEKYSDNPYILTTNVYKKFKSFNKKINTSDVCDELKEVFDEIIIHNMNKSLIGYYNYNFLQNANMIHINQKLTDEELKNIKYINKNAEIVFNINDDYEYIFYVINLIKQNKTNNKYTIVINDKELFNKFILNNNVETNNIDVEVPTLDKVSLNDYLKFEKILYKMIEPANNLSNFEKYIYAYNITKHFKKYKENDTEKNKSRNLYEILNNEYMVCVGYKNLLGDLLNKLGIKSIDLSVSVDTSYDKVDHNDYIVNDITPVNRNGHARRYVNLIDEKYGINGFYIADPTWDNDLENDYYNHMLLTDRESTQTSRYEWNNIMSIFDINNIDEYLEIIKREFQNKDYKEFCSYLKEIIKVIEKLDKKFYSELLNKNNYIDKYINEWPDDVTSLVNDLGNYIVLHVNKPLTGETLFKGIKKIYLNSYGYNEENVMDILEQVREINKQKQEKVFPIRKKLNSDGTIDVIMNETNKFEFNLKNKEL